MTEFVDNAELADEYAKRVVELETAIRNYLHACDQSLVVPEWDDGVEVTRTFEDLRKVLANEAR